MATCMTTAYWCVSKTCRVKADHLNLFTLHSILPLWVILIYRLLYSNSVLVTQRAQKMTDKLMQSHRLILHIFLHLWDRSWGDFCLVISYYLLQTKTEGFTSNSETWVARHHFKRETWLNFYPRLTVANKTTAPLGCILCSYLSHVIACTYIRVAAFDTCFAQWRPLDKKQDTRDNQSSGRISWLHVNNNIYIYKCKWMFRENICLLHWELVKTWSQGTGFTLHIQAVCKQDIIFVNYS